MKQSHAYMERTFRIWDGENHLDVGLDPDELNLVDIKLNNEAMISFDVSCIPYMIQALSSLQDDLLKKEADE